MPNCNFSKKTLTIKPKMGDNVLYSSIIRHHSIFVNTPFHTTHYIGFTD